MACLGPFEKNPRLAVAVSGGADSMALVLLADRWARARGGEAVALTVDHRLRTASSQEALRVVRWLAKRGIACRRLVWHRPAGRPTSALQAKAREARYRLLLDWCRRRSVLHLALAHHAGDQAETVTMRLVRGGLDGLAGMPAVASRDGVRLIRPLLLLPPSRLQATLLAAGQPWIEDPSNRDEAFERVRWRRRIAPGLASAIAEAATEIGQERRRRERAVADLLAEARVHAAGSVTVSLSALNTAAPEIALKALGRILLAVGGDAYPPRQEALHRLLAALASSRKGRTLGGCWVMAKTGALMVCREPGAATEGYSAGAGERRRWDGRFDLRIPQAGRIACLGEAGWAGLSPEERKRIGPRETALALPCLRRGRKVRQLPCLSKAKAGFSALFRPTQPLVPGCFTVAKLNVNII
jgi:tRNA(Ile)-lysidine synthase